MGNPFCFGNQDSDIFYFPVLYNNVILYLLRVFPTKDGNYEGILGKTFVDELNSISYKTTPEKPLTMIAQDSSIVACIGSEPNVIFKYPENTFDETNDVDAFHYKASQLLETGIYHVIDVFDVDRDAISTLADKTYERLQYSISNTKSIPSYKYLQTVIKETQGNNSWCAAYCTAMIIRYVKGYNNSPLAQNVMEYFYTNPTNSDSLSEAWVQLYANYHSIYPTYITSTLSINSLVMQIYNCKPVYLRMQRTDSSGSHYYHAIVLRGYNTNTSRWSVWNPWYNQYEYNSFTMGGSYVPAWSSSIIYNYFETVYDWQ